MGKHKFLISRAMFHGILIVAALYLAPHPAVAGEDSKASNYVYLKAMTLPVIGQGNVNQFISVTVTLEFDTPAEANKAQGIAPRLVDAYLQDLYGSLDNNTVVHNGILDPGVIKTKLEAANTRILGEVPCRILLQNLGQRSLHENGNS